MYADELLKAMRPKLSDYYFDVLRMWLEAHKTHGIFKRRTKFEVRPAPTDRGYCITDESRFDSITVYDKSSCLALHQILESI